MYSIGVTSALSLTASATNKLESLLQTLDALMFIVLASAGKKSIKTDHNKGIMETPPSNVCSSVIKLPQVMSVC